MKKFWSAFLCATVLFWPCCACVQASEVGYTINEAATARAPWKVGGVVAQGALQPWQINESFRGLYEGEGVLIVPKDLQGYRRFLGISTQGYYIVQDFYLKFTLYHPNNPKMTEPYQLKEQSDVTNGNNFIALAPNFVDQKGRPPSIMGAYTSYYYLGRNTNNKCFEGHFENGIRQGMWREWIMSKENSYWIGKFVKGVRQGTWMRIDENSVENVWQGEFIKGQWQRVWENAYASGQLARRYEYHEKTGLLLYTKWYKSGAKSFHWIGRRDGNARRAEGVATFWHENGQKSAEGGFNWSIQTGFWTYWHKNGVKREEGQYLEGHKIGVWRTWDDNGVLLSEKEWR